MSGKNALLEFLALECPFLLNAGREVGRKCLSGPEAHAFITEAVDRAFQQDVDEATQRLSPDATAGDAATWSRDSLLERISGFFRREELKSSLTPKERIEMYRVMVLTRHLDDLLKKLHQEKTIGWEGRPSPQKGFRARGQEAAVGLAARLRRGTREGDVVCPLIRGLPVLLMFMDDPAHVVLAQCGKKGTPRDGRDFVVGDLARGVLPPAAPLAIGTQTLVGMAYAARLRKEDRVFLSIMGEGGTSHGEWHEAVNFAAALRLNVIFVVENNHWALGTHSTEQTAAKRFALKAEGYGIPGVTIFGNDPDEVAAASAWAAERARAGKGPALIELVTYRRSGHAHHDDDRYRGAQSLPGYEDPEEAARWEAADPIALYEERLKAEGLLDAPAVTKISSDAERRVAEAERTAADAPWPEPAGLTEGVFAPRTESVPASVPARSRAMTYDEAIRQGLTESMERDDRVFVLGEDVGGRYGGAFGVTRGLAKQFGADRCLNAPLAEGAIIGAAVGAAIAGMRPVAELQFADFAASGFNALVNNAAKLHWRTGLAVPMVVRLPYGGASALLGGGPFHSQCPEAWFLRTPGLKIVSPATPYDAKGLLTAAIRDGNPVLYMEAKGLYGMFRDDLREEVPLGDFEIEIGKALVRKEGRDLTLLTYGPMVHVGLEAASTIEREGVSVELVDLRTLAPLDEEAIIASVTKTHRVLILHEDSRRGGVGAELAAILAERVLWNLEAPILRVAAPDTPVPYAPPLEHAHSPQLEDVLSAARKLMEKS